MSTSLKRLLNDDASRRAVPPAPVDAVVAGGRARVRRRRGVGAAVAVVLVLVAIAVPAWLTQGGSQDEPIDRPDGSATLTFTRTDGSTFEVGDAQVLCPSPSETNSERQIIAVRGGTISTRGVPEGDLANPIFGIYATVDEVADGTTITLPNATAEYDGHANPMLSAYDAREDSELFSHEEGSSGTIVFHNVSCDPEPLIDVTIDATLGSETFGKRPVRVSGTLSLGG